MSSAGVLLWGRRVANGGGHFDWRDLATGLFGLIGGAGFWSFLTRRGEIRSTEAQQLRAEMRELTNTWKAEVKELKEACATLATELNAERRMHLQAVLERDALRHQNEAMEKEIKRQDVEIAALQAQSETQRREIKDLENAVRTLMGVPV